MIYINHYLVIYFTAIKCFKRHISISDLVFIYGIYFLFSSIQVEQNPELNLVPGGIIFTLFFFQMCSKETWVSVGKCLCKKG